MVATQEYVHHGPPKLQDIVNETQSMAIFIDEKFHHINKETTLIKKGFWRLITHYVLLKV